MWFNSHKFYNLANTTMLALVYPCIRMEWVFLHFTKIQLTENWMSITFEVYVTSYCTSARMCEAAHNIFVISSDLECEQSGGEHYLFLTTVFIRFVFLQIWGLSGLGFGFSGFRVVWGAGMLENIICSLNLYFSDFKTALFSRQHCCLSICSYFGWVWQIQNLRRAGLSMIFIDFHNFTCTCKCTVL